MKSENPLTSTIDVFYYNDQVKVLTPKEGGSISTEKISEIIKNSLPFSCINEEDYFRAENQNDEQPFLMVLYSKTTNVITVVRDLVKDFEEAGSQEETIASLFIMTFDSIENKQTFHSVFLPYSGFSQEIYEQLNTIVNSPSNSESML
ncbi:MAG: hypothetical protein Tsb0021_15690 [Chlamydiales bacterium]